MTKMKPRTAVVTQRRSSDGGWILDLAECPYCKQHHQHGGDYGERPILGFRVPHCSGKHASRFPPDYELKLANPTSCQDATASLGHRREGVSKPVSHVLVPDESFVTDKRNIGGTMI